MPRGSFTVMDLRSLRCFLAAAKHNNLTKAGDELGIAAAAVSQRVGSLESYLRTKLYERRGGSIHLTTAGERAARLAVSVFGEIEALERAVGGAKETAEITLASHDSVLRHLLPDRIEAFTHAHPLARLRMIARPIEETLRLVRANECDLGVVPRVDISDDLRFHAIATYPACLIFQKGHPLARSARQGFKSLLSDFRTGRYPLVILEVQGEDQRLKQAFERQELPFNVRLEVSTIDTLRHYVARGAGVAVIAGFAVTEEDRARLEVLPIPSEFGGDSTYGVVMRRDKHRSALFKSLVSTLTTFDEK